MLDSNLERIDFRSRTPIGEYCPFVFIDNICGFPDRFFFSENPLSLRLFLRATKREDEDSMGLVSVGRKGRAQEKLRRSVNQTRAISVMCNSLPQSSEVLGPEIEC